MNSYLPNELIKTLEEPIFLMLTQKITNKKNNQEAKSSTWYGSSFCLSKGS